MYMAHLTAVKIFPTEAKAEEVRTSARDAKGEMHLIELGDAAIAVKTEAGQGEAEPADEHDRGRRCRRQLPGPLLIGVLFMNPLLGVAAGAASGAIAGAPTDVGIGDKFTKGLPATDDLKPGEAVLFVLVRKVTATRCSTRSRASAAASCRNLVDHTREEALRKALAGDATSAA